MGIGIGWDRGGLGLGFRGGDGIGIGIGWDKGGLGSGLESRMGWGLGIAFPLADDGCHSTIAALPCGEQYTFPHWIGSV